MASHHLIHPLVDAYLATLARRLPVDIVDELADGLTESYHQHLAGDRGCDPDAAAAAAIGEFGEPELVVAAFVRHAPGRRVALALVCSGPLVGGCWAATLVAGHAWSWPVPTPMRLAFGATLLAVVVTLTVAASGHASYRRTRLAAAAGAGLIILDAAALAAVVLLAPAFTWPTVLAVPASLTRIGLTAHALPRVLAR